MSERRTRDVEQLRREFDERFAAPAAVVGESLESLLSIRVAGERFAVRAVDIAELARCPEPTRVPSRSPALLGVIGLRGSVIPVFGLGALLGFAAQEPPRWIVRCEGDATVGLAFAAYDGHVRIRTADIDLSRGASRPHVAGVVVLEGSAHVVLDLKSLLAVLGGAGTAARSNRA
jgi:chemotaxis signal transduction protein